MPNDNKRLLMQRIASGLLLVGSIAMLGACGNTKPSPTSSSSAILPVASSSSISSSSSSPVNVSSSSLKSSSSSNASMSSSSAVSSVDSQRKLVYAVNVGGGTATYKGVNFTPDGNSAGLTGGMTSSTTDAIKGANNDGEVFQSERYGNFSYNVPVTNGTYSIELHFAELYHNTAGARSFNVIVEDNTLFTQMDLFAEVGHDAALTRSMSNISVSDETLTIKLESVIQNATLNGFSIWSSDGGEYKVPPTPPKPVGSFKLHPVGDSITEAYEMESSWRYWLWKSLAQNNFTMDFVGSRKGTNKGTNFSDNDWDKDHDGHTSATAHQVLNGGLPNGHKGSLKVWAPKYAADIAVILLGTNDIRGGRSTTAIINTFKEIIGQLRAANPGVDIVVCQIPYWKYSVYRGSKGAIDSLNAAIPSLTSLATTESKVEIVDLNRDYSLNDHRDGIHPNGSGAKKIAERLLPIISGFME